MATAGAGNGGAAEAGAGPTAGSDPLDELSERVRAAQEAAERILEEATRRRGGGREPGAGDARGTGASGPSEAGADRRPPEAQALLAMAEAARGLVPPELRQALADLLRELLLLMRTLIDWYLERLEERRRAPVEVEDIPIT